MIVNFLAGLVVSTALLLSALALVSLALHIGWVPTGLLVTLGFVAQFHILDKMQLRDGEDKDEVEESE